MKQTYLAALLAAVVTAPLAAQQAPADPLSGVVPPSTARTQKR